jgi:polar amino acid transport system substrate-binding protein
MPGAADARTFEAVKARGTISVCAHANALPFSSRSDSPPGFQIEIARALARQLGVGLTVAWVVSPIQYRAADCDIVLDTIVDPAVQEQTRLRVSKPYYRAGVALALPAGTTGIRSFGDLPMGQRVGVQVGSVAQMILSQRGLETVPFGFEDEMVEALSKGSLAGAAVSPATVGYFNLTHPHQPLGLVHAYEQEASLSWNVAVGMRGSDGELGERIDAALDRLLGDGTIRDIYARYGIEHRPPAPGASETDPARR